MVKSFSKKTALCYLVVPAVLTGIYLYLAIGVLNIPVQERVLAVMLSIFLPGGIYTAVLLGIWLSLHISAAWRKIFYGLFFITFPLVFMSGIALYLPLYLWNAICLIRYIQSGRMWRKVAMCVAILLTVCFLGRWAASFDDGMWKQVRALTPEGAFTQCYPGGQIIGDIQGESGIYLLGKKEDGGLVCCHLIQENEIWRIENNMRRTTLEKSDYGICIAYAFRGSADEDVILIEKKEYPQNGFGGIGNWPTDTAHSEFAHAAEKISAFTFHYYWALADCEQAGYDVTGW